MNSKHRKMLEAVFSDQPDGNFPWENIEALLVTVERAYFHRPHPQREALKYRIKAAREFLSKLEITP